MLSFICLSLHWVSTGSAGIEFQGQNISDGNRQSEAELDWVYYCTTPSECVHITAGRMYKVGLSSAVGCDTLIGDKGLSCYFKSQCSDFYFQTEERTKS